jgi:hypothetical protein
MVPRRALLRALGISVAVGSRGISRLQTIVRETVDFLKNAGARPFIVPAMGSHGGATPEGQQAILAGYGITEEAIGAPVQASMEVQQLGTTEDGVPVYCSQEALKADGILLVNRVKPHTDFQGKLGSGLLKMLVIGLGKRAGAAACHQAAARLGHEQVIRTASRRLSQKAPLLGGLAILENHRHDTARLTLLAPPDLESQEERLLEEADRLMPRLPFPEVDLLIVDHLGKNISGAGMDPNVIGRGVQGYLSTLTTDSERHPMIRRIFVRELTPETHGNAIGIGLADFTTTRLVRSMDLKATYINSLTAMTPQSAKIPIHYETDREALEQALISLALPDSTEAKVVRIQDTLNLEQLEVSENYKDQIRGSKELEILGDPCAIPFDAAGNLNAMTR